MFKAPWFEIEFLISTEALINTLSELASSPKVVFPSTCKLPVDVILPLAWFTLNAAPPTVKFAPVTSKPFVASTLPANVTWLVEPVWVNVLLIVTAPSNWVVPSISTLEPKEPLVAVKPAKDEAPVTFNVEPKLVAPVAFNVVNVPAAAVVFPITVLLMFPPLICAVVNVAAFAVKPAFAANVAPFTVAPLPAVKAPVEAITTSPAEPSKVNELEFIPIVVAFVKLPPNSIVPELFVNPFVTAIELIASLTAFSVTNLSSWASGVFLTVVLISSAFAPVSKLNVPLTVAFPVVFNDENVAAPPLTPANVERPVAFNVVNVPAAAVVFPITVLLMFPPFTCAVVNVAAVAVKSAKVEAPVTFNVEPNVVAPVAFNVVNVAAWATVLPVTFKPAFALTAAPFTVAPLFAVNNPVEVVVPPIVALPLVKVKWPEFNVALPVVNVKAVPFKFIVPPSTTTSAGKPSPVLPIVICLST